MTACQARPGCILPDGHADPSHHFRSTGIRNFGPDAAIPPATLFEAEFEAARDRYRSRQRATRRDASRPTRRLGSPLIADIRVTFDPVAEPLLKWIEAHEKRPEWHTDPLAIGALRDFGYLT